MGGPGGGAQGQQARSDVKNERATEDMLGNQIAREHGATFNQPGKQ